jgi:hypothetical protein
MAEGRIDGEEYKSSRASRQPLVRGVWSMRRESGRIASRLSLCVARPPNGVFFVARGRQKMAPNLFLAQAALGYLAGTSDYLVRRS